MARYEFLNLNPLNEIEEDCVCRSISLALQEDYYLIQRKLELVAELFECMKLCECCYRFLLDSVYDLQRVEDLKGIKIRDFVDCNPHGTYLIRIENHLTAVIDGTLFDLWNCLDEKIDILWKVC